MLESLVESVAFRKADVKEAELRLWSIIFMFLLKLRIYFYTKMCVCLHRHIVPLHVCDQRHRDCFILWTSEMHLHSANAFWFVCQ